MDEIMHLLNTTQSVYYDGPVEGLYLKYDESDDADDDATSTPSTLSAKSKKSSAAAAASTTKKSSSTSISTTSTMTSASTPTAKLTANNGADDAQVVAFKYNIDRAKIVRAEFVQQIEQHWTSTKMVRNSVIYN